MMNGSDALLFPGHLKLEKAWEQSYNKTLISIPCFSGIDFGSELRRWSMMELFGLWLGTISVQVEP